MEKLISEFKNIWLNNGLKIKENGNE